MAAALVLLTAACGLADDVASAEPLSPTSSIATEVAAEVRDRPAIEAPTLGGADEARAIGEAVENRAAAQQQECIAEEAAAFEPVPDSVTQALSAAADHPTFEDLDVSISIWVDGWGEVLAVNPDMQLAPASNQKILVSFAANERLDSEHRFSTTIEHVGANVVLRASGDPTLRTDDVRDLARQVALAGETSFERLIIDVSPYTQPPRATGWLDWQIPLYVGPLSGLVIDDNRWTTEAEFVANPALVNGSRVQEQFAAEGISIGAVELGAPPEGDLIAVHESAPLSAVIQSMMLTSDNQIADLLVMELGRASAGDGNLANGIAGIDSGLVELCVPIAGVSDDGSGLSRSNQRSAREFQQLLVAMRRTTAGAAMQSQLPIGGVSGTLRSRFGQDPGRVQAKTGTIIGGRSLSGYVTTDSGREAVFSIIVNGDADQATASLAAIDNLVVTLLRS